MKMSAYSHANKTYFHKALQLTSFWKFFLFFFELGTEWPVLLPFGPTNDKEGPRKYRLENETVISEYTEEKRFSVC